MTKKFTDDMLVAFLEGRLGEKDLAAIETAINADPALAERAENLTVSGVETELAQQAFAPIIEATVPDRLVTAAGGEARGKVLDFDAASRRTSSGSTARNSKTRGNGRTWHWPQFAAMAASLVIGVFFGGTVFENGNPDDSGALVLAGADGPVVPRSVGVMLDTASSGQNVQLANLGTAQVVLSFRSIDQQLCRQYTIGNGAGVSDAVACRAGGQWRLAGFGTRAGVAGEMRTAGGDASPAVIAVVDQLIDSDALIDQAERVELEAR